MNIVLIHKAELAVRPPVISSLLILSDLGHRVTLIDEKITDYWKEELDRRGISFFEIRKTSLRYSVEKLYSYYNFRNSVYHILKRMDKETIVWVEGAQTMVALGRKLNKYRHILQIQELHEKSKMQLRAINKVIHTADAVFMPEWNRTQLYRAWFKLEKNPYLLPNKPYFLLTDEQCCEVLLKYHDQLSGLKNKKVILYQGGIKRIRMLDKILRAIKEINEDYHLLIVGKEQEYGIIKDLRNISPEVTHVDFVPAPYYLAFCKLAHVGYVTYEPCSLNNIYCAPNKIFEYSAYGLPMIANDIPGLRYTVGISGAGELVDPADLNSIIEGLKKIEENYLDYRTKAIAFNKGVDNKETITKVLMKL